MAFHGKRPKTRDREPVSAGSMDIESEQANYTGYPDTMYYPGFFPQYRLPGPVHFIAETDPAPNHIDRGGYSHGSEYILDGPEQPMPHKDSYIPNEIGGVKEEVYPEKDREDQLEPVRVEVVNRDPIQRRRVGIHTYFIGTPAIAGSGTATKNGLTPIQILPNDPHRVRALITFTAASGTPILMTAPNQAPGSPPTGTVYGFPLSSNAVPLEVYSDTELWASGQTTSDVMTISVLVERTYNADPDHNVQ